MYMPHFLLWYKHLRSTLIKNILNTAIVVVVQSLSQVQLFNPMDCMQRAKLNCLSLPSGVCANSCPLSRWCHPTISSSATPFSCFQSFPASELFPVSQLFTSNGQSIGASASASVLPVNIQNWFPLGWTGLIFLLSKDSQESSYE